MKLKFQLEGWVLFVHCILPGPFDQTHKSTKRELCFPYPYPVSRTMTPRKGVNSREKKKIKKSLSEDRENGTGSQSKKIL